SVLRRFQHERAQDSPMCGAFRARGARTQAHRTGRRAGAGGAATRPRAASGAVPGPGLAPGYTTAAGRPAGLRRGGSARACDAGAGQPDPEPGEPGTGHPGGDLVLTAHAARPGSRDSERRAADRDGTGLEAAAARLAAAHGDGVLAPWLAS